MLLTGTHHVKDECLELVNLLGITLRRKLVLPHSAAIDRRMTPPRGGRLWTCPSCTGMLTGVATIRSHLGDHDAKIFWCSFCHV